MRVVYGARCVWWDTIDKAGSTDTGLPCCPHCSSPLFEMPDENTWWEAVKNYNEVRPGYTELVEWMQGKCFPTLEDTERQFEQE